MRKRTAHVVHAGTLAVLLVSGTVYADAAAPSVLLQKHVDALYRSFHGVASERAVVLVELSPANRLFAAALRDHPAFASFLRTNAKGVIINEVVRDRGAVRAYRSVANQRWYAAVKSSLKPYQTVMSDRHGGRILLWAEPVLIVSGAARRFGGVVAVKIDLLACFRQVAEISEYPFRVVIDGTPAFAHRWETDMDYDTAVVEIPGFESVVVLEVRRSPERATPAVSDFGDTAQETVMGEAESVTVAASVGRTAHSPRLPVGRIVSLLLLLTAAAGFVRSRLRHRAILRMVLRETGPA